MFSKVVSCSPISFIPIAVPNKIVSADLLLDNPFQSYFFSNSNSAASGADALIYLRPGLSLDEWDSKPEFTLTDLNSALR
jgi:hypothetical protein